jgi:DNA polymerase-3 subunit beta
MNITLPQEKLARALAIVSRIASSRTTLPILTNILIKTENNQLILTATNLEVSITEKITAKIDQEGVITAPARFITEFVANLPKTNVTLQADGAKLTITAGNYHSVVNVSPADEFPDIPEIGSNTPLVLSAELLKKAIATTTLVASADTTRPILTGVYIHTFNKQLYFAATDGYRLAEKRVSECSAEISAIVPAATLNDVMRVLTDQDVKISFSDDQVGFVIGDTIITSRLIDGKFIDYRQLIPTKTDVIDVVDRMELTRITKIAELFARESAGSITLISNPETAQIQIHSITSELGENDSVVDAVVTGAGQITLNSRFLLDALGCLDSDTVKFQFSGKLAPVMLTDETDDGYKHIIMPVRS